MKPNNIRQLWELMNNSEDCSQDNELAYYSQALPKLHIRS